jgi:hypothetical protein
MSRSSRLVIVGVIRFVAAVLALGGDAEFFVNLRGH